METKGTLMGPKLLWTDKTDSFGPQAKFTSNLQSYAMLWTEMDCFPNTKLVSESNLVVGIYHQNTSSFYQYVLKDLSQIFFWKQGQQS